MAMKKRFYSVNGQMMACESGGVKKDFITDHLGSITAEMDQSQTRTYDARYSAYGKSLWSTGSNSGFGWVGSFGYRETGLSHMSHYVRARHYSYTTGTWSTVDPLWPDESAYGYVNGHPTTSTDPTGFGCGGPPPSLPPKPCRDLLPKDGDFDYNKHINEFLRCMVQKGGSKEGINECLKMVGDKIKKEDFEKLKAFIACVLASRTDPGLGGGKNACDPPNASWGQSCCYMKFLNCLFACVTKGGFEDVSVCVQKCDNSFSGKRDGKGGFKECLALAGPGEGGYNGPPSFGD